LIDAHLSVIQLHSFPFPFLTLLCPFLIFALVWPICHDVVYTFSDLLLAINSQRDHYTMDPNDDDMGLPGRRRRHLLRPL
jgi:hypothetical protein